MPQFLALEVVAKNSRRTKGRDDAFPIGDWRSSAIRIVLVRLFLFAPRCAFLPKQFAIATVKAHQRALVLFVDGLRDENAITPNDGRGVARFRKRGFPTDIFCDAPFQ